MYSDYEDNRTYPLRKLLVGIVLVILFVLLLVWLLPTSKVDLSGLNGINSKLDVLTNRIFSANIDTMKEAGISYYTNERLPKEIGDKSKLTLREMLDKKLVLDITDKEGKACDAEKSYVEVTKTTKDEYEMKVNLKCGEQEDYIIVHLGCYNYCEGDVCEKAIAVTKDKKTGKTVLVREPVKRPTTPSKTVISGPSCELMVQDGTYGKNGWFTSNVNVGFKYKASSTSGAQIVSYGLTEAAVPTYGNNNTHLVSKDGTTVVYGYVKDTNNKTAVCTIKVKKDAVAPTCRVEITDGVKDASGSFVGNVRSDLVSRVDRESGVAKYGMDTKSAFNFNSKKTITTKASGKQNIYGFVEDNAGNRQVCNLNYNVVKPTTPVVSRPSCELEVKEGSLGNNGWYRSNVTVGFKSKNTTDGAKITGYGVTNGAPVYNGSQNFTVTSDGYHTVKGYVKDSNGYMSLCSLNVKRDLTKPTCSLGVIAGNYSSGGYYIGNVTVGFKSRIDNLSGVDTFGLNLEPINNYNRNTSHLISTDGTHISYGSIRDNAGNVNVCALKTIRKSLAFEYQYSKYIGATYSNWSSWITKEYNKNTPPSWLNTDTYEAEDLGGIKSTKYQEKIGEPIMQQDLEYYKSVNIEACDGYDYFIVGNKTEDVYAQTTNRTIYTTKTTETTKWIYEGTFTYSQPPTNTLKYRFEYAGPDWEKCPNVCVKPELMKWKKYRREVGTTSTTTASPTTSTTTYRKVTSVNYNGVSVKCSKPVIKPVKIYAYFQKQVGFTTIREPISTVVYKYRYRTRNLLSNAYTSYKWSTSSNDTNLISQGYKYTGNRRVIG